MPVNEFEKQVQKKMEELKLQPGDQVWVEVEKRIRREKKRRRIIFWWLFAGLLTAGTGAFFILNRDTSHVITQHLQNKQVDTSNTSSTINNTNSDLPYKKDSSIDQLAVDIQNSRVSKQVKRKEVSQQQQKSEEKTVVTHQPEEQNISTTTPPSVKAPIQKPAEDDKIVIQQDIKKDTVAKTVSNKQDSVAIVPETSKKLPKKKENGKWEFSVNGFAGVSGKSSGLSIGSKKELRVSSPSSGPAQLASYDSRKNTGFSWQIGLAAKRKLAERTGISVGLGFSYYSTTQPIGVFVDSTRNIVNSIYAGPVRGFYRNDIAYSYRNHYYYLQLPVSFGWQINKGKKLPLSWQNGLSLGIFMGGNALQYDPGTNVYYHDNRLLNKVHLSYRTGLQAELWSKGKRSFTIGISYDYHFSHLQKIDTDDKNHLFSYGVRLGWIFKK